MENENYENYKEICLSILGGTASGKTTFLSSLLICMMSKPVELGDKTNPHNIRIEPIAMKKGLKKSLNGKYFDNSEDHLGDLKKIYSSLVDNDGEESVKDKKAGSAHEVAAMVNIMQDINNLFTFPDDGGEATEATATTRYIILKFNVLVDDEVRCRLVVTDYAGEIVDLKKEVSDKLQTSYAMQIAESDGAIILANATILSENIIDNPREDSSMFNVTQTQNSLRVDIISNVLYVAKTKKPYTVMVAISQSDHPKLHNCVKRNNFVDTERNLQEYIYTALYSWAKNNKIAFGILPTSAFGKGSDGQPCVDENNMLVQNYDPHPEGIDKAVLFCLYNISLDRDTEISGEIERLKSNLFWKFNNSVKENIKNLQEIQRDYAELRAAILDSEGYFDDVYETSHHRKQCGDYDPRFPKERKAVIQNIKGKVM